MTVWVKIAIVAIVSYFIGNISPSIILGRLAGVDIKKEGSGNAGTTNTLRVLGTKAALITLAIDILKGVITVKIGYSVGGYLCAITAMIAVVIGHVFPAIYKFKGGKGVATAFGAALALDFPSALIVLIVAIIVIAISGKMSVASIMAAIVYPFALWYYNPAHYEYLAAGIFLAVFIIFNHRANIKRLFKGEEPNIHLSGLMKDDDSSDESDNDSKPESQAQDQAEPEPEDYYDGLKIPKLPADKKMNIAVVGNGSFGTAIANLLVHNGHQVMLYGRNKEAVEKMKETRMNEKYLPYVLLSDKIKYTHVFKTATSNRDIVIFAVPAQSFRKTSKRAAQFMKKDTICINLAKGIEQKTLKRLSEIAEEELPEYMYVTLSGPTHAEEVVRNYPAGIVAACKDIDVARTVQDVFMNNKIRVYTNDDIVGVEIAGAIKNVIAITTGISDGMNLGNNSRAALMTRAIHEIKKLGKAMGAKDETFSGLTGIGDLIVTCSTSLSRNRRCGLLIGHGLTAEEAVEKVGSVVEGYYTAGAATALAKKYNVDMPITSATYAVLQGKISAEDALNQLLNRDRKEETE